MLGLSSAMVAHPITLIVQHWPGVTPHGALEARNKCDRTIPHPAEIHIHYDDEQ